MSRTEAPRRSGFRTFRRIATRWSDNDVYGHVNNTIYYQWFDTAVNGWLVDQGLLDIEHGDPIALVVETRCSFFSPLSFPGDVDVGLAVRHLGRSSVRYGIGVFGAAEDVASATGEFVHVAVDRLSRRPVPWPPEWHESLTSLQT